MRPIIIAGNWKMNTTLTEAKTLASAISALSIPKDREVVLCPPFISLASVSTCIQNTALKLGGQTLHHEDKGAYTGEISGPMLKSVGCDYVIIGHSERRHYFNETNPILQKKLLAAWTRF